MNKAFQVAEPRCLRLGHSRRPWASASRRPSGSIICSRLLLVLSVVCGLTGLDVAVLKVGTVVLDLALLNVSRVLVTSEKAVEESERVVLASTTSSGVVVTSELQQES